MSNTTANLSDAGTAQNATRPLMWARLGSLVSILPLGIWTAFHLWDNLTVFRGAVTWEKTMTEYRHPYSFILTMIVVLLPLLIHAVWGIQRLVSFKPNNASYPYFGNLKYAVQRLAGLGTLLFIGAHMWLAFLQPRLVKGHGEYFSDIAGHMHYHLPTLIVYLLGTLGVAYHLANGFATFTWQWGLVSGRKSYRRIDLFSWVIFAILLAMAWGVIIAMYQAGAAYRVID
jgi:succinate dehydrogenase / fumarate reductase cytochrome b subunit